MDCIFCKIANGEIPSAALYEDGDFKVILDLNPLTKGHALILPKTHVTDIYEASDEVIAKAFGLAGEIARKMKKSLGCDGVNVVQNNEEAAGQTVMHMHIHVIPRYADQENCITWKHGTLTDEMRDEVLAKMAGADA